VQVVVPPPEAVVTELLVDDAGQRLHVRKLDDQAQMQKTVNDRQVKILD